MCPEKHRLDGCVARATAARFPHTPQALRTPPAPIHRNVWATLAQTLLAQGQTREDRTREIKDIVQG